MSQRPSAPSVPSRLHARQMAAAMREAMPSGDVHRTAVTILPMTVLNTCSGTSGLTAFPPARHGCCQSTTIS